MTSCDKRLEELLNRAGQTIADLPKDYLDTDCIRACAAAQEWVRGNGLFPLYEYGKYILHLTDIIDRMEWALDKTLQELAYTRAKCCYICGLYEGKVRGEQLEEECEQLEYCMEVYEDWREDDADI